MCQEPHNTTDNPIVFFDGHCHLCDYAVQFILKKDKKGLFKFTSLQGAYARKHLPKSFTQKKEYTSVYVKQESTIYEKSDAVYFILIALGGKYKWLGNTYKILPKFLRDGLYTLVAKYRFVLMGRKEHCSIESPQQFTHRILD